MNAVITGVGGYVPDYILTNDELSHMVDTDDEWIMSRIGIKKRHILKEKGKGTSYMATKAVKQLLAKTKTLPQDVDLIMVATSTPDHPLPSTASLICEELELKNAFAFDVEAACSGFLYLMEVAAAFISLGRYKKIVIVGADKMSAIINYTDRSTCPIFSDGAAAFMIEPGCSLGIIDSFLRTDGFGFPYLNVKSGGSAFPISPETINSGSQYLHQDGKTVFKYAVLNMTSACNEIMARNNLNIENIDWVVPHQANVRIIDAIAQNLRIDKHKVLINIEEFGNTSAATLPLCIWYYENQLKKGDNLIFTAFGAGFCWGAIYVKWGY